MSQVSELTKMQAHKVMCSVRDDAVEYVVRMVMDGKIPMQKEAVLTAFCQYVGGEEKLRLLGISLDNIFNLVVVNVRWMNKKMAK